MSSIKIFGNLILDIVNKEKMKKLLYLFLAIIVACSEEISPEQVNYTLTVTASDGGLVSTNGGIFLAGTEVTITATPNQGYVFSGWSNGSLDNPITLTVNSNQSLIGNFQLQQIYIDYNVNSYSLKNLPLWIDKYSIPKSNGVDIDGKWYDVGGNLADFNNDGYLDVIFSPTGNDVFEEREKLEIYLNNGTNNFFELADENFITNNIGNITARKTIIGDFNGDNLPDAFFADHGIHTNYPGGTPSILLSNENNYDFSLISALPRGFYHTCASADIDNDGDLDIYIPALENQNSELAHKVLINDGLGNFSIDSEIIQLENVSVSSELFDIDNDGNIDLVSGAGSVKILFGGYSNYSQENSYELFEYAGDDWEPYDYIFYDFDGNGLDDIVVSFSNGNGYKIRIFKQTASRYFEEFTEDLIQNYTDLNHSIVWIKLIDVDNNGNLDLVEEDKGHFNDESYSWPGVQGNIPKRWEWDGNMLISIQ